MPIRPFHLAIPVHDLKAARKFYCDVLGCPTGRSTEHWMDFDLYGHQLVCHEVAGYGPVTAATASNFVDDEAVPIPHFGVVLEWHEFEALAEHLHSHAVQFLIEPSVRFVGLPGEQATMFLADPSGNMLEFKAMRDPEQLFSA
ncbi:MAG: glyoxalase [Gammaproteobacteria bacterium]|nr:MAG: glyoxalase [Gammaproteobacteria bacterium]